MICSLELPEKINIFKWRAIKNSLSIVKDLWKRKVSQNPICPRCKMKAKSITPAVMDCNSTKQMWMLTPFMEEVRLLVNQDLLSTNV